MKAATTRAAALIHTRPSKLTTEAPLVVVLVEGVPVVEGAEESVAEEEEEESLLEVCGAESVVGLAGEVNEIEADDEAPLGDASPPPKLGAATAVEGSTRAPLPQGMASFEPGWVALGGGTDWPLGEAIVKRVVHALSVV